MLYNKLKFYREENNMSQSELADLLKKDKSTISRYEKNKTQPPDSIKLEISRIFKVSIEDIFFQENIE